MNQRERMLSELPYKAWLDGLEEERKESRKRVYRYNNLPPEADKEKDALIREIFGNTGSVVTKDIPDNAIAVGNPCRVIRYITEEDRKYYFKDREFDVDDYK